MGFLMRSLVLITWYRNDLMRRCHLVKPNPLVTDKYLNFLAADVYPLSYVSMKESSVHVVI